MTGRNWNGVGASRRSRVAFDDTSAQSSRSPIRMDGWRQQALLSRGRSLPDVAAALHPKLRELVERKVPIREPALGKTSDSIRLPALGQTSDSFADPVTRRKAITQTKKGVQVATEDPAYRPSPWARSVTTKAEKRGRASDDHEDVSAPWRKGYMGNGTQHVGMGKDLLSAEPTVGAAIRPMPANAGRNYSLYVTYKRWVGPTCYTPMPSTRGSLSTTAGSNLHSRGSLLTPLGLTSAGAGSAGSAL